MAIMSQLVHYSRPNQVMELTPGHVIQRPRGEAGEEGSVRESRQVTPRMQNRGFTVMQPKRVPGILSRFTN